VSFPFVNKIFLPETDFNFLAKELFLYQYRYNKTYKAWCDCLNINIKNINQLESLPFLPISFFKTHTVISGDDNYELFFESSGTTQSNKSRHYIKELNLYIQSFTKGFRNFYGDIKDWCIIGLLPSYLQQKHSSLVKMVDELIAQTNHPQSGFYLHEYEKLFTVLQELEHNHQKTLLIGVTYALLDFAAQYPLKLSLTTIMETGGMKGRRKELTRNEVHDILKKQFQVQHIHSEYGMSELLSQAYSKQDGRFYCPPWMRVFIRGEDDPLLVKTSGKGALNIIDLANANSCAFIATEDVGEVFSDGSFTVAGRLDGSDIRGCSLMVL
jgi:hypothetical protein